MLRKRGEPDAGSTEATEPAATESAATESAATESAAQPTPEEKKKETVAECLKRKADLQDCIEAFHGGEVSQKNFIAIQRRMLGDYINSIPLSFTQMMETCLDRLEGEKHGEQPTDQPASGQPDSGGTTSASSSTSASGARENRERD
jgi:hypothetical protein